MARRLAFVAIATLCLACCTEGAHDMLPRDVLAKHASRRILRGSDMVGPHSDAGGALLVVNRKLDELPGGTSADVLTTSGDGTGPVITVTPEDGTNSGTTTNGGSGSTSVNKDAVGPLTNCPTDFSLILAMPMCEQQCRFSSFDTQCYDRVRGCRVCGQDAEFFGFVV